MREFLKPKMTTALEVAVLVKCLPDIKMAAELIEDYARLVAAGVRLDATVEVRSPVVAPSEYEATLDNVAEAMR